MASTPLKVAGSTASHVKDPKVQFIFTGFRQDAGVRVFAFEDTGKEKTGIVYSVRADLGIARRYGIATQELPLLCRGVLERLGKTDDHQVLNYTEDEMCLHASNCKNARLESLLRKKSKFRPPSAINRIGWRAPRPGETQGASE